MTGPGASTSIPDYVAHYDVKPKDSLWKIASMQLGAPKLWMDLAKLNWLSQPYTIRPGQRLIVPNYRRYDVTIDYIHKEMLTNAAGKDVQEIIDAHKRSRNFNAEAQKYYADAKDDPWYKFLVTSAKISTASELSEAGNIARLEALARWTLLVRQNGPWDHKPKLREMYEKMSVPRGSYGRMGRAFHFPIRGDVFHEFYYDIWSNIHFGYVGTKAGFDEQTLQGARLRASPAQGRMTKGTSSASP